MTRTIGRTGGFLPVLLLLLATGGCTRFDALNATVPSLGYHRTANLVYGKLDRQKLDVYQPWCAKPDARVVVFFYGGHWSAGEKADYRFVAQALTSRGFIAVLPDYRVYPEVTFPAFVEDGALAVRWVHDHISEYGGDPQHVYLMGHSAGAHIVALLDLDEHYLHDVGLDSHAIRATAALSGPYDFVPSAPDLPIFNLNPGDTPYPAMEPIKFASNHAPPIFLVHGLQDDVVEVGNATRLADKILAANGQVDTMVYRDRAHVGIALALAWSGRYLDPVLDDVALYFRSH